MTFHGGYTEQILFDQWNTKTVGGRYFLSNSPREKKQLFLLHQAFVGSWFAVFLVAVLYEGLKSVRDSLARRELCETCSPSQNRTRTM